MRLLFWRGSQPNFGDELNPWIWPKLVPGLLEDSPGTFVGIGSILDDRIPTDEKVMIFGTGARSAQTVAKPGSQWDVRFVRGPLTAEALGGVRHITDPAYCLRLLPWEPVQSQHTISLMPHIHSLPVLKYWRFVCAITGIRLINPCDPLETVIAQIRSSKLVLAAAMHGAIVADAFRVPWIRIRSVHPHSEGPGVNDFKWTDWMRSIGVDAPPMILQEPPTVRTWSDRAKHLARWARTARRLRSICKSQTWLSNDAKYDEKLQRLSCEVDRLKNDYADFLHS